MRERTTPRAARGLFMVAALVLGLFCTNAPPHPAFALSADVEAKLGAAKYVYISTQRKDGSFGAPAEIWFLYHQGAVWVASQPTAWRVKRIRHGRPNAKIALARGAEPVFMATGSIVKDPAVYELLYKTYAEKYPDGWPKYEQSFRKGLPDGSRVLIKYQPIEAPKPTATAASAGPAAERERGR